MYFQPAAGTAAAAGGRGALAATLVCTGLVLAAGLFPGLPIDVATSAERAVKPGSVPETAAGPQEDRLVAGAVRR